MLIVDSQVHIWAADTPQRPWPKAGEQGRTSHPQRPVPLCKEELLKEMDAAGVQGVVIVPPSWEGDYNDLALAAAKAHPSRFAIMGRIDTEAADAPGQLKSWRQQPGMLGLRFLFPPQSPLLKEGAKHWLWGAAEKAGLPITIAPRGQYALLGEIAQRHPGLRLSVDHMGADANKRGEEAFALVPELVKLARHPNIAVKVSALPCVSGESYPFRNTHPHLRRVVDAFGPARCFWGTDLSRFPCSYSLGVFMFTEELPWLKGADLELVMGKALCRWWGWDLKA
jgi:predicted TIM-barrel fold metal-dependent hydrolase